MKQLLFVLFILLFSILCLQAHISSLYMFFPSTGTYTTINGTTVPGMVGDDVISAPIDIGFPFIYGITLYSQVKICSNGYITLGDGPGLSAENALASTSYCPVVAPLWDDTYVNGSVQYLLAGTSPNRVLTIQFSEVKWNNNAFNGFNYQVKLLESGTVSFVYGSSNGTPANASASIGMNMLPGGTTNFMSITPGTNSTVNDSVENNQVSVWPGQGTIYTFNIVPTIFYDLAALSITGNSFPSLGVATTYNVTIRNMGVVDLEAGSYEVKLMNGTTQLASVSGVSIIPGAVLTIPLTWIPMTTGSVTLTGKVVLVNDQNIVNNVTSPIAVVVMSGANVIVTVGDGSQTDRIPVDMCWRNSLFETIYYANELNLAGVIGGLIFYNNFTTNLPNKPVNIWLGETTLNNLSAGWIPSTQLTPVFSGNVNFPSGSNGIIIEFPVPFVYMGGNLVMLVERPMDTEYYAVTDRFLSQTVGTSRSRLASNDVEDFDPANPPNPVAPTNGSYPKTSFLFPIGMPSSLSGNVSCNGTPLSGVTVSVGGTALSMMTNATGSYHFPFIPPGNFTVTFTKPGYVTLNLPVVIIADQETILNATMAPLPLVNVTGTVAGSDAPAVGLPGVTINLAGITDYQTVTDNQGQFSIPGVMSENTYSYTFSKPGYQNTSGTISVGTSDYDMGTITLTEVAVPVTNVNAVQTPGNNAVNISWSAPALGGEWIHWDSDENNDSIGTGGVADFDVASRWPAADLINYTGQSLFAVKFYPNSSSCSYNIRVWTGGNAASPATMVVDQVVDNPILEQFNTIILNTPVPITAGQELWFGVRCNTTGGYPIGCDAGPAHNGLGNMMFWQGSWTTLLNIAPALNYDWNLSGFVGFGVPTDIAQLPALPYNSERANSGILVSRGVNHGLSETRPVSKAADTRSLLGYRIWRLLAGAENNEATWSPLTNDLFTALMYTDNAWTNLPDGRYRWAVKAFYSNDSASVPAFSNEVQKTSPNGTLAGIVRNSVNAPLSGSIVRAGTYTATTNASGAYTMILPADTYVVIASHLGNGTVSYSNIVVAAGQTTYANFVLPSLHIIEDGFEDYQDFSIDFAPWSCSIGNYAPTYTNPDYAWENEGLSQAFMVFNPSATTPPSTDMFGTPHGGAKMATCWAASIPPNNAWLISPIFNFPRYIWFSFWAKSMSAEPGLEQFKVYYSPGSTQTENFVLLSGDNPISAPTDWTYYEYDLPAWILGNFRIAIQCVSDDGSCFQVDDFTFSYHGAIEDNGTTVITSALQDCYPNPFKPHTTISYTVKDITPVTIEVFNVKGQKVKTLVKETKANGRYSISWNGLDDQGNSVSGGIYFYKMTAGKYQSVRKMVLLK